MMLELESLATVGALEAAEDGGLIMADQVALQTLIYHAIYNTYIMCDQVALLTRNIF